MFGYSPKTAVNAYSQVSLETGVLAADPHKLIVMLFEGAITAIHNAAMQMDAGKIPDKGRSISHAIAIIENGLRASLNKEVGGELARNLDALYGYMAKELLLANLKNDHNKLAQVKKLLMELKESWEHIAPEKTQQAESVHLPEDHLEPRKVHRVSA